MAISRHRARFDWLVELGGASALGLGAAFAASKAATAVGFAPATTMLTCGFGCFAAGLLAVRVVDGGPPVHALPSFPVEPIDVDDVLELTEMAEHEEEPLLLDTLFEEPVDELALLLEDVLPQADVASRVVQLFAVPQVPTAGQLKERIDRHLAVGAMHIVRDFEGPAPDASDALYSALNELKRSLR